MQRCRLGMPKASVPAAQISTGTGVQRLPAGGSHADTPGRSALRASAASWVRVGAASRAAWACRRLRQPAPGCRPPPRPWRRTPPMQSATSGAGADNACGAIGASGRLARAQPAWKPGGVAAKAQSPAPGLATAPNTQAHAGAMDDRADHQQPAGHPQRRLPQHLQPRAPAGRHQRIHGSHGAGATTLQCQPNPAGADARGKACHAAPRFSDR